MSGESILVVEDEGLIALHLTEILERAGYRISGTVYSGEKALRKLDTSPQPDLVLMDIGLAGSIDGIETAKKIRQRFTFPIIFLTAYSDEARIEKAKEVPSTGFLVKPVTEEDLITAIRKALDQPAGA